MNLLNKYNFVEEMTFSGQVKVLEFISVFLVKLNKEKSLTKRQRGLFFLPVPQIPPSPIVVAYSLLILTSAVLSFHKNVWYFNPVFFSPYLLSHILLSLTAYIPWSVYFSYAPSLPFFCWPGKTLPWLKPAFCLLYASYPYS